MTSPRTLALAAVLALSASGCLTTHDEAIRVRRTEEMIEARRPKTFEQLLREQEELALRTELPPALSRTLASEKGAKKQLRAALARRSDDPWLEYESERRRVLVRHWHDVGPPPGDEPGDAGGF